MEIGDPTETALVNLGLKLGEDVEAIRDAFPREAEIPFDSDRKLMTTVHKFDGKQLMVVKGAVDVLTERMTRIQTEENGERIVVGITEDDIAAIKKQNQSFSENGLRVLAFAYKEIEDTFVPGVEDEKDLTFLGLISMMDPPREESKAAVAECINGR